MDKANNLELLKIIALAKNNKTSISWIPREINVTANKIVKIQEWYILDLFYKMLLKQNIQPK